MEILKWIGKLFKSKKFTAWFVTMLMVLFNEKLGLNLSAETVENVLKWATGSFLVGQGFADGMSKGATSNVTEAE